MQFYLPRLVRITGLTFRLAVIESLVTLVVVGGVLWWAFPALGLTSEFWAIVPALALGAIAVASTPAGLDIALRDRKRREPVVNQLETSLGVNAFVAIVTVGILFAWVHRAPVNASRPPTPEYCTETASPQPAAPSSVERRRRIARPALRIAVWPGVTGSPR
jgi:hypothetical protein